MAKAPKKPKKKPMPPVESRPPMGGMPPMFKKGGKVKC